MSTRDIYEATNDGQVPRPTGPEQQNNAAAPSVMPSASGPVVDTYVAPRLPDQPIPIRTPAEVMRIWVAPWEDTNGDLITSGYIYTEIEPKRWVIGDAVQQRATRQFSVNKQ